MRREVARAIDERAPELPHRYVRIQVQKLTRAVTTVADVLSLHNLAAVDPLLKLIDKLDRYHGLAPLYEPRRGEAPAAPAAPAAPVAPAPLALPADASARVTPDAGLAPPPPPDRRRDRFRRLSA